MSKIKKFSMIILILIISFLLIVPNAYAKKLSEIKVYKDMIDAYREDKNVINQLNAEQVKKWKSEFAAAKKIYDQQFTYNQWQGIADLISGWVSGEEYYGGVPKAIYDEINEVITKLDDRERQLNSEEQAKEDKEKTEEELKEQEEEYKDYNHKEIMEYVDEHTTENVSDDVKEEWKKTIDEAVSNGKMSEAQKEYYYELIDGKTKTEIKEEKELEEYQIYVQPSKKDNGNSTESTLDDMISDADSFVNDKNATLKYNATALQNFSKSIYNIAVIVGIFVAVIVGGIIGIKLMSSNIETQVQAKKLLIPYVVGCVVVFGGFLIWRVLVTILQTI